MSAYAIPSHPIPGLESRPRLADFAYGSFSPPLPALRQTQLLGMDGLTDPPAAISLMASQTRGRKLASGLDDVVQAHLSPPDEQECSVAGPAAKKKAPKRPKKVLPAPPAATGVEEHMPDSEQIFSVVPISTTGVYYARLTTILRPEDLLKAEENEPTESAGPLAPGLTKAEVTISNTLGNLRVYASEGRVLIWVLITEADKGAKWVRADQGFAYPSRTRSLQYVLSLRDPHRPSWVKKETLAQYDCRSKQRILE